MASLILPAASITKTTKTQQSQCCFRHSSNVVSFSFASPWASKLCFSPKDMQSKRNHSTVVKAQSNEVSIQGLVSNCSYLASLFVESCIDVIIHAVRTSNAMATPEPKLAGPKIGKKDVKQAAALASEASISEFMARVSILVKLVNSRDIVELQLKQSDCELVIRKTEALPHPPPPPNNMVMMHSPPTSAVTPSALPLAPPAAVPTPSPASSSTQAPTPPPSAKSSLSPLKCPMAGTFYRSPAPGEPVFVKVGDKVQKGQVVCIIEAMKLMNEIEADRTGTIVEILVDDGKPVSVDLPLFVIEP